MLYGTCVRMSMLPRGGQRLNRALALWRRIGRPCRLTGGASNWNIHGCGPWPARMSISGRSRKMRWTGRWRRRVWMTPLCARALLDLYQRWTRSRSAAGFERFKQGQRASGWRFCRMAVRRCCHRGRPLCRVWPALFDAVSVGRSEVGLFTPRACCFCPGWRACFGLAPPDVLFVSSPGWAICSGAAYGFRPLWVPRAGAPPHAPLARCVRA